MSELKMDQLVTTRHKDSPIGKPGLPTIRHNELTERLAHQLQVTGRINSKVNESVLESQRLRTDLSNQLNLLHESLPKDRTSVLIFLLLANLLGLVVLAILVASRLPVGS